MLKLFLVAGEASGDARGAELMKSLLARDSSIEFFGLGCPQMRAIAGEHFHDWSDRAVIGLLDVLKNYGYFKRKFEHALAQILQLRPDAVIFIDYPGFNLRLAKALKERREP